MNSGTVWHNLLLTSSDAINSSKCNKSNRILAGGTQNYIIKVCQYSNRLKDYLFIERSY